MVERLERAPLTNVIVLTSLSKLLGVPGLRLGYIYSADSGIVAAVGDEIPALNLGAPAEFMLELVLNHRAELSASIQQTIADRAELERGLAASPLVARVYPSGGNFLLVDLAAEEGLAAARLRRALIAEHRIDVRDVTDRFPGRCAAIARRGPLGRRQRAAPGGPRSPRPDGAGLSFSALRRGRPCASSCGEPAGAAQAAFPPAREV